MATRGSIGRLLSLTRFTGRRLCCQSVQPASRAHLRSHSGSNAGTALAYAPTSPEYTIPPHLFWVIVLERLQLPLPVAEASCTGCGAPLDPLGRHRASCPRTGRVKIRAGPIERVLARICREAGARVRFNALLRDMNVGVPVADNRRIEILTQDLPCFGGAAQLAVDVTLRGGFVQCRRVPSTADIEGVILSEVRRDKERRYPELVAGRRCRLVVVAIETADR